MLEEHIIYSINENHVLKLRITLSLFEKCLTMIMKGVDNYLKCIYFLTHIYIKDISTLKISRHFYRDRTIIEYQYWQLIIFVKL